MQSSNVDKKISLIFEPIDSDEKLESIFFAIREQCLEANLYAQNAWNKLPSKLNLHFQLIDFKTDGVNYKKLVDSILTHELKEDILICITHKDRDDESVDKNWIKKNNYKYFIEIIVDDSEDIWINSPNHFSARVRTSLNKLHNVMADIFLEVIFEIGFEKYPIFRGFLKNADKNIFYKPEKKIAYIKKFLKLPKIVQYSEDLKYFPFSSISRYKSNHNLDYLYEIWMEFLIYESYNAGVKNYFSSPRLPLVTNVEELKQFIPREIVGQISDSKLNRMFDELCSENGLYAFVKMRKGISGVDLKVRKRLDTLFTGKIGMKNMNILPFKMITSIIKCYPYILFIPFKKK